MQIINKRKEEELKKIKKKKTKGHIHVTHVTQAKIIIVSTL